MSNYPLWKRDKSNPEILTPQNSFYSEEYCESHFDLYLTTHLYKNENGKFQKYYRLHASTAHTPEQAFAYEIKCPNCGNTMKQVGSQKSSKDLGLYTCKHCKRLGGYTK